MTKVAFSIVNKCANDIKACHVSWCEMQILVTSCYRYVYTYLLFHNLICIIVVSHIWLLLK